MATTLGLVAFTWDELGEYGAAEPLHSEACAIWAARLPQDPDKAIQCRLALGRNLLRQDCHREAEICLLSAWQWADATPGIQSKQLISTALALTDLYQAWHAAQPDMNHESTAAEWDARHAELQIAGQGGDE